MDNTTYRTILDIESKPDALIITERALHDVLRMMVDAGEIVGIIKKVLFTGKPIDRTKLVRAAEDMMQSMIALRAVALQSNPAHGRLVALHDGPVVDATKIDTRLLHGVLGKFDESAELANALLQAGLTGEFDRVNFQEELGDDRFYTEVCLDALGITMDDVQAGNYAKLKDPQKGRYKDGFSAAASENRDKGAERELLEATTK